MDDVKM